MWPSCPKERQTAILGIDWGSTAIRVSMFTRQPRLATPIMNTQPTPTYDEHYARGAFNSAVYFAEDRGRVLTMDALSDRCQPVPSKAFFSHPPKTGCDALDVKLADDQASSDWECMREALESIIEAVLVQVEKYCNGEGEIYNRRFYITEIGVSHPDHWGPEELSRYEGLLRVVMVRVSTAIDPRARISFHVESLALAHTMFCQGGLVKKLFPPSIPAAIIVFLDFGGYTMNGCMFNVRRNEFGDVSYHRVGDTFSAFGGTQQWEHLVGRFCTRFRASAGYDPPTTQQVARLLENFHRSIKRFATDQVEPMVLHSDDMHDAAEPFIVTIPYDQSNMLFTRALEKSLRVAEAKIAEASRFGPSVKVVLSGGSGKSSVVRARLRSACESQGLSEPLGFYETFGFHDSWNISKGAAIAAGKALSVTEFFEGGAAFGFQTGTPCAGPGTPGDAQPSVVWEEAIPVALDWERSYPLRILCDGATRIRIICDPYLQSRVQKRKMKFSTCFDLVELPRPCRGTWEFTLSFPLAGEASSIVVERVRLQTGRAPRDVVVSERRPALTIPLYYDTAYNCCLVDADVFDEGRGLCVTDAGEVTACPKDTRAPVFRPSPSSPASGLDALDECIIVTVSNVGRQGHRARGPSAAPSGGATATKPVKAMTRSPEAQPHKRQTRATSASSHMAAPRRRAAGIKPSGHLPEFKLTRSPRAPRSKPSINTARDQPACFSPSSLSSSQGSGGRVSSCDSDLHP